MLSRVEAMRMMQKVESLEEIIKYCKIAYPMKTQQQVEKLSKEILAIKNGEDICINQQGSQNEG